MKKFYIATITTIVIGLIGLLWADTKEEIAKKANNETIMQYIQHKEIQRVEDKAQQKEDKKEQQELNQQILQSIQMMLIQRATEGK